MIFFHMTRKDELMSVSGVSLQNVQLVLSCNPILHRKLLVGIRLCKDLKWNSISLGLFSTTSSQTVSRGPVYVFLVCEFTVNEPFLLTDVRSFAFSIY